MTWPIRVRAYRSLDRLPVLALRSCR